MSNGKFEKKKVKKTGNVSIEDLLSKKLYGYANNKMYKTYILKEVPFEEDIYFEDSLLVLDIYLKFKDHNLKIKAIEALLYDYLIPRYYADGILIIKKDFCLFL